MQMPGGARGMVLAKIDTCMSSYNVKGELDCFNCKTGVFLRFFTSMFTKESNYNPRFCEKNQLVNGEYLIIIKCSHTAASTES